MILLCLVTAAVLGPTLYALTARRSRTQRLIWVIFAVLAAWSLEIWYVAHLATTDTGR
jgi:hypothetical protein